MGLFRATFGFGTEPEVGKGLVIEQDVIFKEVRLMTVLTAVT